MRRLVLIALLFGAGRSEVFQTPLISVATDEDTAVGSRLRSGDIGEHAQIMDNYRNARYLIEVEIGKEATLVRCDLNMPIRV